MAGAECHHRITVGFSDSETKACSTWLSIGMSSMPASFMTRPVRARHGDGHLARADLAARGGDAGHPVAVAQEAGHLAILDDVDAAPVCRARKAPGDRVMAGGAGARLQQPADDGEARRARNVEARHPAGDRRQRSATPHRRRSGASALPRRIIWSIWAGVWARLMMPRCENITL